MQLGDDDRSNVEDRRGMSLGGPGLKLGVGGTVVLLLLSVVFKQDLFSMLGATSGGPATAPVPEAQVQRRESAEADLERTAVRSFNDAQAQWRAGLGGYRDAKLVLFWDETRSGCGDAAAAMGPFYCPQDEKVYLDLGFYRELARRFGIKGEFAEAYVVAHELGHHVQNLLGTERKVHAAMQRRPSSRGALSVRMELQADCYAGIWGRTAQARGKLDAGDVEQGLAAAAAVGDDRIQKATTGTVHPESFTHGSAAERSRWFRRGLEGGRLEDCDTFAGE